MNVAVPLHEIRAEFAELDDPVDRTTYLIEIGRTLPPLDEHWKTEENRVLGCQARVWLVAEEHPGSPQWTSAGGAKAAAAGDDRHRAARGGVADRCGGDSPRLSDFADHALGRLPAGLPRQCGLDAAAQASDRRDGRGLRALLQQRA